MKKDLNYYMGLPYSRVIEEKNDESGHYYYGYIKELQGCQSTSDTREEIFLSLDEAMKGWLEVKLEGNLSIPEPEEGMGYVGRACNIFRKMSRLERMESVYRYVKCLVEDPGSLMNCNVHGIYDRLAALVYRINSLAPYVLKKYTYVAVFTPEDNGMFSVNFPDLDDCYTCGNDREDAVDSAKDVLIMSILGYVEAAEILPAPTKAESIQHAGNEFTVEISVNLREYVDSL